MKVAANATSRLVKNERRKDFNAKTFTNHLTEKDSIGKVIALPPPKAVTVIMNNGIIRNAKTNTAQTVRNLFLRMFFPSPIQARREGIEALNDG